MRTRAGIAFALLTLAGAPRWAAAGGGAFNYDVFRATVSVPYVAQMTDGQGEVTLVNGRLTNSDFVNLGMGRDPDAPVPKNQILVVLNPDDYIYEANARFAIVDTATSTVLRDLTRVDQSLSGYGKPDGSKFFLFADGSLLDDLTSPTFSIGQTSISGSAKGRERGSDKGNKLSSKVVSMVGTLPLTIDGVSVPAVILKGKVRISGKALFSFPGF
jgi:hypothetical protein